MCRRNPIVRKIHRSAIRVEALEERALLSHVAPAAFHHAHRAARVPRLTRPIAYNKGELQGGASGSYNVTPSRPGVAANYNLSGAGDVSILGNVQVNGTITVSVVRGRATRSGVITLSNANGMIRIRVQGNSGPLPAGPAAVTSPGMALKYTILNGTGAYRNVKGTGNVSLALAGTPQPVTTPPVSGGGGTSNGGGGQAGQGGGTGITTPPVTAPPVAVPPVAVPPVTMPPVSVGNPPGSNLPPSKNPPTQNPPSPVGPPVSIGGGGGQAIRALTPTPLGGPTFLSGTFILMFNSGQVTWPPML
jgi:hypothetical protein